MQSRHDSLSKRSFEEWGDIWTWILLARLWDPETLFCLIHFHSHMIVAGTFAFIFGQADSCICIIFHTLDPCFLPDQRGVAIPESRLLSLLQHSVISLGVWSLSSSLTLWFLWLDDFHLFVSRYSFKNTYIYILEKSNIIRICQNIDLFYFFGQYDLFWTTCYSRRFYFISWCNVYNLHCLLFL